MFFSIQTLQTAALPGSTPTTAAHDSASEGSERLARPPSMLSSTQMTQTSAVAQPEVPSVGNSLATNPDNRLEAATLSCYICIINRINFVQ